MSECTCAIDSCDNYMDGPEVYRAEERTATKEHRCGECRRTIEKGERLTVETGLWDGAWYTHKTCVDCLSIRTTFFCTWIYETLFDELRDYIQNVGGNVPNACMLKLTPAARSKVFDMIRKEWEIRDE